jgi:hypothetical protein
MGTGANRPNYGGMNNSLMDIKVWTHLLVTHKKEKIKIK